MSETLVAAKLVALATLCSVVALAIDRDLGLESKHVMIVVYTVPNLSERMLSKALEESAMVFGRAGVDVSWTTRRRMLSDADVLDEPNRRQFEKLDPVCAAWPGACFIAQISDRLPDAFTPKALGISRPYGKDPGVVRATVFLDRVTKLAARMGMPLSRLLGAVITHELGHVLSGTDAHGQGLMRNSWTLDDFHDICHAIPEFDTAEVRLMHMHLRAAVPAVTPTRRLGP